MNNKEKLEQMVCLQDQMNSTVNPEWKTAGYDWLRAAWIECAELMDHVGWKWWKKQTPNLPQARIELVDIFHFLLSDAILSDLDTRTLTLIYKDRENKWDLEGLDNLEIIELFAEGILEDKRDCKNLGGDLFALFFIICDRFDLSFEELYKLYIGKNALNLFRQQNGYKEGTYIKEWNGVEDNVYLDDILKTAPEDVDLLDYVLIQLQGQYNKIALGVYNETSSFLAHFLRDSR